MILAFRLAWRDLRGGFGRFTVFILCLALGMAAMAAVDIVSRGITDALTRDGRTILGGDLVVRMVYAGATPEQRRFLDGFGTVSESANTRAMARAGGGSALVELKAVDKAYPLYGALDIMPNQALGAALQGNGAAADSGVLTRLDMKTGDTIEIGGLPFRLGASIVREPDLAGSFGLILGPRVMVSLDSVRGTALVQPGNLVYWNYAIRLAPGTSFTEARKRLEARAASEGWQVRSADDANPSLKNFIDRLTQFLILISVSALAVGGIGIANATKAALESRFRAIAILKCLGGSRRLVFATFLIEVLAMAALGTILGTAAGMGLPVLGEPLLASILPVAPHFHVTAGMVLAMLAYGLLVTLIFALPVLFQAEFVSPAALFRGRIVPMPYRLGGRQMIAIGTLFALLAALLLWRSTDRGLSIVFLAALALMLEIFQHAGDAIERLARRLAPRLRTGATAKLALGNLHRPGNRTRDITVSLGMGLAVLIAVGLVESNFRHELDQRAQDEAPAFFFLDVQKTVFPAFEAAVKAVPGTSDFEATPMLRGRIVAVNGIPAATAIRDRRYGWVLGSDRGITYGADFPMGSRLIEGAWWSDAPTAPGEARVSIATEVANAFALHPGGHITVSIAGREITAEVANVREVRWGTLNINFTLMYAPGALEGAPQTWLATVRASDAARRTIARDIVRQFPNASIVDVQEALQEVGAIMGRIATAIRIAATVILATGALVLLGAISAGFEQRLADAVIMKVLGATRPRLFAVFLLEYGGVGLAASIVSLVLGGAFSWWIVARLFGFDWSFHPRPALIAVLLSLGLTLGAGFVTTLMVLGRKAAPYLRNE